MKRTFGQTNMDEAPQHRQQMQRSNNHHQSQSISSSEHVQSNEALGHPCHVFPSSLGSLMSTGRHGRGGGAISMTHTNQIEAQPSEQPQSCGRPHLSPLHVGESLPRRGRAGNPVPPSNCPCSRIGGIPIREQGQLDRGSSSSNGSAVATLLLQSGAGLGNGLAVQYPDQNWPRPMLTRNQFERASSDGICPVCGDRINSFNRAMDVRVRGGFLEDQAFMSATEREIVRRKRHGEVRSQSLPSFRDGRQLEAGEEYSVQRPSSNGTTYRLPRLRDFLNDISGEIIKQRDFQHEVVTQLTLEAWANELQTTRNPENVRLPPYEVLIASIDRGAFRTVQNLVNAHNDGHQVYAPVGSLRGSGMERGNQIANVEVVNTATNHQRQQTSSFFRLPLQNQKSILQDIILAQDANDHVQTALRLSWVSRDFRSLVSPKESPRFWNKVVSTNHPGLVRKILQEIPEGEKVEVFFQPALQSSASQSILCSRTEYTNLHMLAGCPDRIAALYFNEPEGDAGKLKLVLVLAYLVFRANNSQLELVRTKGRVALVDIVEHAFSKHVSLSDSRRRQLPFDLHFDSLYLRVASTVILGRPPSTAEVLVREQVANISSLVSSCQLHFPSFNHVALHQVRCDNPTNFNIQEDDSLKLYAVATTSKTIGTVRKGLTEDGLDSRGSVSLQAALKPIFLACSEKTLLHQSIVHFRISDRRIPNVLDLGYLVEFLYSEGPQMQLMITHSLLKGRAAMKHALGRRRNSPLAMFLAFENCAISRDDKDAIYDTDQGLAAIIESSMIRFTNCDVLEEAAMNNLLSPILNRIHSE